MEIRASDLKKGKRIPFKSVKEYELDLATDRYDLILLWNKMMDRYEIASYDKPKHIFWSTTNIFRAVNQMNIMSQHHNKAIDDSSEWSNDTGKPIYWENNNYNYSYI